jgi:hypothetical protein
LKKISIILVTITENYIGFCYHIGPVNGNKNDDSKQKYKKYLRNSFSWDEALDYSFAFFQKIMVLSDGNENYTDFFQVHVKKAWDTSLKAVFLFIGLVIFVLVISVLVVNLLV